MERLEKCQICGLKIAVNSCKKCGKGVCENCFHKAYNVCLACLKTVNR
ncbi:hypothetical protein J4455_02805 [Candidatus Woesearchaeota archaeon]|nr:hypothetical protein [Candidatus Woesearchaeota archaeon]